MLSPLFSAKSWFATVNITECPWILLRCLVCCPDLWLMSICCLPWPYSCSQFMILSALIYSLVCVLTTACTIMIHIKLMNHYRRLGRHIIQQRFIIYHPEISFVCSLLMGKAFEWMSAVWRDNTTPFPSFKVSLQCFWDVFDHSKDGKSAGDHFLVLTQDRRYAPLWSMHCLFAHMPLRLNGQRILWREGLFRKGLNHNLRTELACRDEGRTFFSVEPQQWWPPIMPNPCKSIHIISHLRRGNKLNKSTIVSLLWWGWPYEVLVSISSHLMMTINPGTTNTGLCPSAWSTVRLSSSRLSMISSETCSTRMW